MISSPYGQSIYPARPETLTARILFAALAWFVLFVDGAYAEEITVPIEHPDVIKRYDKGSTGIIFSVTMAGIQGEYRFIPDFGLKMIGLYIIGADFNDLNTKEYILSGLLVPVWHMVPDAGIFDPVLMCGAVYSFHHWNTKLNAVIEGSGDRSVKRGNIHDVTFGAGFGLNFNIAKRFKFGVDLWLNYDYQVKLTPRLKKKKGRRIILPLVLFEFAVNF